MPARDLYHDVVVRALQADGWTITADPLVLSYGGRDLFVDLGAERELLAAERAGQKIGVEVKSFISRSAVLDLELAVGQYTVYREVLAANEPERTLYLAVPGRVFEGIFSERLGRLLLEKQRLLLLVFDPEKERIVQWTS